MLSSTSIKDAIIEEYKNAYEVLCNEQDLSPNNDIINQTLSNLVSTLSKPIDSDVALDILNDTDIQLIRKEMLNKLSIAESLMERYYAQDFLQKVNDLNHFSSFIYWDHYVKLVQTEISVLRKIKSVFQSCAFVGTGPLPLSPLLIQKELNTHMTCIDYDQQAYELGNALIEKVHKNDLLQLRYVKQDGVLHNYRRYDLVWIASLVENKEEVLKQIYKTNPHSLVAIRSADGVHQLLYEQVDAEKFEKVVCKEVGRTIADSFIINSTIFFKHA